MRFEDGDVRGDADLGDTYYRHWLAALESLVAAKGASTGDELRRYADAWDHAADRTPHGRPIELQPGDFAATSAAAVDMPAADSGPSAH